MIITNLLSLALVSVLVSERRSSEEPELGDRPRDVTFPRTDILRNVVNEQQSPPAVITIPGALLSDNYKGKLRIWTVSHILARRHPLICQSPLHSNDDS